MDFDDAMNAVEEAANKYDEGWSQDRVVDHLTSLFGLTEPEAQRLVLAVENTRRQAARRTIPFNIIR